MHQRNYEFSLWFVGKEEPQLSATEFWPPDRDGCMRCERNYLAPDRKAAPSGGGRISPLRWTWGVQAMCLFFLQTIAHAKAGRSDAYCFEGPRPSPASTLNDALDKDGAGTWVENMFGSPPNGNHTYLYFLIHRLNPGNKKGELPFSLQPNPETFIEGKISVYWEGKKITSLEVLVALIQKLRAQWKDRLPTYDPRIQNSPEALEEEQSRDSLFEETYKTHIAKLTAPELAEFKIAAFGEIAGQPAPTEAFHMEKLQSLLSAQILNLQEAQGRNMVRFTDPEFAIFTLRQLCDREHYPLLFLDFLERCPKLAKRVFDGREDITAYPDLFPPELAILNSDFQSSEPCKERLRAMRPEDVEILRGAPGFDMDASRRLPGETPRSMMEPTQLPPSTFETTASKRKRLKASYPEGTRICAVVKAITSTNVFFSLRDNDTGTIHADEFSKAGMTNFSERFEKGQRVDVIVDSVTNDLVIFLRLDNEKPPKPPQA